MSDVIATLKAAERIVLNPRSGRSEIASALASVDDLNNAAASAAIRATAHEWFLNHKGEEVVPFQPAPEEEEDAFRAISDPDARERALATTMPGFGPRHVSRAIVNRVVNDLPASDIIHHLHDAKAWCDVVRHVQLHRLLDIIGHPAASEYNARHLRTDDGRDALLKRLDIESAGDGQHLLDALQPTLPLQFVPTLYRHLAQRSPADLPFQENPLLLFIDGASPDVQALMPEDVWRQFWEQLVTPQEAWYRVPLSAPLTEDDAEEWMETAIRENDMDALRHLAMMRNISLDISQRIADYMSTARLHKSEAARDALLTLPPSIYAHWRTALSLTGGKVRDDDDTLRHIRELAWLNDADPVATALAAIDWLDTPENRDILKSAVEMMPLVKTEVLIKNQGDRLGASDSSKHLADLPVTPQSRVEAMHSSGEDVAELLNQNIFSARPAHLDGRHSAGSFFIDTPSGSWYMKPGSGRAGPIKGIEDDLSPPSARESAFWQLARSWGLAADLSRTEWMRVDGDKLYAAIFFLPAEYRPLIDIREDDAGRVLSALESYRLRGRIWQWSVLDWVAGNGDRHGHNMLMNPDGEIRLIDHGSTFAGVHFDPAHDRQSFTPYYLRFMLPFGSTFNTFAPKDKLAVMPDLPAAAAMRMKSWLAGLSEDVMADVLRSFDIDPRPEIMRLRQIKNAAGDLGRFVNGLWAGL
jgi:hypothetical protein